MPMSPLRRRVLKTVVHSLLSVTCIVGGTIILWLATQTLFQRGTFSVSAIPVPTKLAFASGGETAGLPVRLKIPAIHVDAPIDHMSVTKNGEMESPQGAKNVGWFKFGARPGDVGSAVIAGHHGRWLGGEGSVFDNLSKLKNGDEVHVEGANGATATFVVRQSRTYNRAEAASEVFSVNDGKAHLNLVTCQGAWREAEKTYDERLVVFTDRAPQ